MGIFTESALQEPKEVRCVFRTTVEFVVRNTDVSGWREFIRHSLPNSYSGRIVRVLKAMPMTIMELSYEAASANANDVIRRLRAAEMFVTPVSTRRERTCGCPSGTTRCQVRTGS